MNSSIDLRGSHPISSSNLHQRISPTGARLYADISTYLPSCVSLCNLTRSQVEVILSLQSQVSPHVGTWKISGKKRQGGKLNILEIARLVNLRRANSAESTDQDI